MRKSDELSTPKFTGPIAEHLSGFLQEKRALGFKYRTEPCRLSQIDRLSSELYVRSNTLPQDLVDSWCVRTPSESNKTWRSRIVVINQLTEYFIARDLECHKTTIHYGNSKETSNFIPHIFSYDEMRRIFNAADTIKPTLNSPHRHSVASLLFRLLYSCGLRIGEALTLKNGDVDLENGIITVYDGKNKIDRYAPMNPELTERCNAYVATSRAEAKPEDAFFASPDGGFYANTSITHLWNQLLRIAGIPKTDAGPRIHDLRHTFAVGCLKKWVRDEKDINALLPVLSAYLGHKNLGATGRYLRLTAEVYPEVTSRMERHFGELFRKEGNSVKRTDNLFQKLLGDYLGMYLPAQRNFSKNTIASYCDTFRLLLQYLKSECGLMSNSVTFNTVNRDGILKFLNWLEKSRKCSSSTINQRLSAVHSFFKYVQGEAPQLMKESQQVLNIPTRKTHTPLVSYLCKEDLELILQQPDISTKNGRRDLTILCVLYDTGGRVQEIADLTVSSVRLQPPAQVTLVGKGGKARTVPLMAQTVKLLENYLKENNLYNPQSSSYPLFFNQRLEALSRSGISYVLRKYALAAKLIQPKIPDNITPHLLRHSKAMHLLEAGVNIIYIRDILGHADVSTTGIYAKSNLDMKRRALEKVAIVPDIGATPFWTEDLDLLDWLKNYGKSL